MTSSAAPSRKALSKIASSRLQKELVKWQVGPPAGFKYKVSDNLQRWVIEVGGAAGTLYAGETYQLQVDFPEHYPMEAPQEAMAFIFGPKTNRCLDREYLQWFRNLDDLKNLNWCDFIADLLCREIKKFNASTATFKKCGGCLLLPMDVFYDLVTPKDLRPKGFPRANYITQANLNTVEDFKELEKLVTFEAVEELYEFYNLGEPNDPIFKKYKAHAHQQHSSEQA